MSEAWEIARAIQIHTTIGQRLSIQFLHNSWHYVHRGESPFTHNWWSHEIPDCTIATKLLCKTHLGCLWEYWIDTYLRPLDHIRHDAGTNFTSKEFWQLVATTGITTKSVSIEAHWSVRLVERAHLILCRVYCILVEELKLECVSKQTILQMAVKAVNNISGPDGLVPTLFVSRAYPHITKFDPPTWSTTQRALAIKKAMAEVSRIRVTTQVNKALHERNGPSITDIYNLPLNSPVLVWRKGNTGRSGP